MMMVARAAPPRCGNRITGRVMASSLGRCGGRWIESSWQSCRPGGRKVTKKIFLPAAHIASYCPGRKRAGNAMLETNLLDERQLIADYERGDLEAVRTVDGWIDVALRTEFQSLRGEWD